MFLDVKAHLYSEDGSIIFLCSIGGHLPDYLCHDLEDCTVHPHSYENQKSCIRIYIDGSPCSVFVVAIILRLSGAVIRKSFYFIL
jgi:hypothetical protein